MHRPLDEACVLHVERLVESELLRDAQTVFGGRVLAQHEDHWVADVAEEREGDEADGEHDEDRLADTPQDECRHGSSSSLRECYRMQFAQKVVRWQRRHGRRDLPWQGTRDPYRIWLSEVML